MQVRVMVLSGGAYATMQDGAMTLDVRLNPGKAASVALLEYVREQRERAARILRHAEIAEQGAALLSERGQ